MTLFTLNREDILLEVAEGAPDNLVRHGILCNMIMVQSKVSDKAIIQSLSRFPETAEIKDSEGNFPLHLAMNMKRSVAVCLFRQSSYFHPQCLSRSGQSQESHWRSASLCMYRDDAL